MAAEKHYPVSETARWKRAPAHRRRGPSRQPRRSSSSSLGRYRRSLPARSDDDVGDRIHQLQPPHRHTMVSRGRVWTVLREDVHPQHHVDQALPVGSRQLVIDFHVYLTAVVETDLQPQYTGSKNHHLADTPRTHDTRPLAVDAVLKIADGCPFIPAHNLHRPLDGKRLSRYRRDQGHGQDGGVLRQHVGGVSDDDVVV